MFEPSQPFVTWWGLGAPVKPGRLPFGGGVVDVGPEHIRAWMDEPEGVWQATVVVAASGTLLYRLSRFYPGDAPPAPRPDRTSGSARS